MVERGTKKNKKKQLAKDIWNKFDSEFLGKNSDIECVYDETEEVKRNDTCSKCGHQLKIGDLRFMTCSNNKCGIIYKDKLDMSAEWRYYGVDDNKTSDPTRCGMPINPLLAESSFGCKVVCSNSASYEMKKIRRYTEWQSMPYKEKANYDEFQKINMLSLQAGIPKIIIDEAFRCHKKVSDMKTFRGCNRDGIIAASIYIASRVNGNPRTAKEIATIFNLDNTASTKGCKNAVQLINKLEKDMMCNEKTHFNKTTPSAFIERYCSKLNINSELTKLCLFIAKRIDDNNKIPENTPHSVAAGIIYFVVICCKLNVSKREVNHVSEISEVTINKCYKKLMKIHNDIKLIPDCLFKKYT
jgi:transcription initiation factor TFIIB